MGGVGVEIETERLKLRFFREDDLPVIVGYRSLPEVARYQFWDTSFSLQDAEKLLNTRTREPKTPGWLQLGIEERETSALCGDCGIRFVEHAPDTVEVGITLAPEHQGRGIGNEALGAVVRWCFVDLEMHRVYGETDDLNVSMRRLFERLDFRLEARLVEADWFKGEWSTLCTYALLNREWNTTHPQP